MREDFNNLLETLWARQESVLSPREWHSKLEGFTWDMTCPVSSSPRPANIVSRLSLTQLTAVLVSRSTADNKT